MQLRRLTYGCMLAVCAALMAPSQDGGGGCTPDINLNIDDINISDSELNVDLGGCADCPDDSEGNDNADDNENDNRGDNGNDNRHDDNENDNDDGDDDCDNDDDGECDGDDDGDGKCEDEDDEDGLEQGDPLCFDPDASRLLVIDFDPEFNLPDRDLPRRKTGLDVEVVLDDLSVQTTDRVVAISGILSGQLDVEVDGELFPIDVVESDGLVDVAVVPDRPERTIKIHYPRHNRIIKLFAGDDISEAAAQNNVIIMLGAGTFSGDVTIEGNHVLLVGACSEDQESLETVISGDIRVRGNKVQLRALDVRGDLRIDGNNGTAAFCNFDAVEVNGQNAVLFHNRVSSGSIEVNGDNAVLVDNFSGRGNDDGQEDDQEDDDD